MAIKKIVQKEAEISTLIFIEIKILELVYLALGIGGIICVFFVTRVHWYAPIVPLVFYLYRKSLNKKIIDATLATQLHRYRDDEKFKDYFRSSPDFMENIYQDTSGKRFFFPEMFELPRNVIDWLLLGTQWLSQFVLIVAIGALTLWGGVSATQFIIIYIAVFAIILLVRSILFRRRTLYALERWTANFMAELEINPDVKSALIGSLNLVERDLPFWIQKQLILMVDGKINPDHIDVSDWVKTIIKPAR